MRVRGRNQDGCICLANKFSLNRDIRIAKTVFPLQTDRAEDVFAPPSVVLPL